MKKKLYLFPKVIIATSTVFLLSFLMACSNSSDAQPTPTLAGQWKLVNVRGGFAGVDDSFPAGQILWNIDTANNSVTVTNNNTNPNMQDILDSGVYGYVLQPDPNSICSEVIKVNNLDMGCYSFTSNELVITYEYADGYTLTFVR